MEEQLKKILDAMNERFDAMDKRFDDQKEILNAIRAAQDYQKAQIDGLNLRVTHIEGQMNDLAEDIGYIVRKIVKHDQAIRELQTPPQ